MSVLNENVWLGANAPKVSAIWLAPACWPAIVVGVKFAMVAVDKVDEKDIECADDCDEDLLNITNVIANFNPNAVTKVDYRSPERPPLLLLTGEEDRICPPSVNRSNWKKQHEAATATEHKEYPYYHGMPIEVAEVKVQDKAFIATLAPWLDKYIPD